MAEPHKESICPPTKEVVQMIKQRVTAKWPGIHVGVLWVWQGGQRRFAFKWDKKSGKHVLAKGFGADDQRILCLMSYSMMIDAIEVLNEGKRKG